ncbi:MAG: CDP-diacylglycerol--glycerol-3-phosphate 3-phosphatidyltransferase [Oscillospiraceae bacterium]|nr:CDP-diacylglycerol--glycerol-3-phosphate 3-phosphatidyltransferase [Oscillospiraceae bacterium]
MNIPNKLTISRIIMTPVFLAFIAPLPVRLPDAPVFSWLAGALDSYNDFVLNGAGKYVAGFIFLIAFLTDAIDGYIARKYDLVTDFGKFLDPIADKLLVAAALIALAERGEVSGWAAVIIISREFIVTGFRLVAASGSGLVIEAGTLGKLKTVTQFIALTLALFDNIPFSLISDFPLSDAFMFVAVVLTVVSGAQYIIANKHILTNK